MLKVRIPRAASMPRPTLPSVPRPSLPRPSWAMIGIASVDAYRHESYRRQLGGAATAKALREIGERIDGLTTDTYDLVDGLTTDTNHSILVDRVNGWIDATNGVIGTLSELDDRVDTIVDDVTTASAVLLGIDARINTVVSDASDTDERVQDVAEQVDALDYRLDYDVDEKIGELVNDAAVNSKAIDDVTARLDIARNEREALGRSAQTDHAIVDAIDSRVAETSAKLGVHHDKLGTLAEAALITADKLADLKASEGNHCEALNSLDGELNAAAETVVGMLREIDALRAAALANDAIVDALVASQVGLDPDMVRAAINDQLAGGTAVDDLVARFEPRQLDAGE